MTLQTSEEVHALLIFYANGSLNEDETRLVEDALQRDPALRRELHLLETLRAEMQSVPPESAGEIAARKLMSVVNETEQESLAQSEHHGWRRFGYQAVAGIALLAIVVQSGFVWWGGGDSYELAGREMDGNIVVAFNPETSEANIREILLELDLQIVAGPSSLGLYRLLSDDPDNDIAKLTARSDVVEGTQHVEN